MQNFLEGCIVNITYGAGCSLKFFEALAQDSSSLLITTAGMVRRGTVAKLLGATPKCSVRTIGSNPDLNDIDAIRDEFVDNTPTQIVGMGGGSALDTAKLVSFLLAEKNLGLTLSQLLREGADYASDKLPLTLLPTTSGTGSEVTPYACVWDRHGSGKYKYTFANPVIAATRSFLDPTLTVTVPRQATINAALDTCSHAIETLWNKNATKESVALANQALGIWLEALPKVLVDLGNLDARMRMQWASLVAGRAISISKTAIAHSISYPVTYHYGVPHGLACSFALKRLATRVSEKNAWRPGTDTELLDRVMNLYDTLDIDRTLSTYCSAEQIRSHTKEMFTPGRSDSFVLSENDVLEIFNSLIF